ncbi:MAG: ATP-binding protein, partial [candidate division WOR-3 bacterium]
SDERRALSSHGGENLVTTLNLAGARMSLSLCRQLLDLARGSITVQTSTSGTTFRFTLPVQSSRIKP